MNSVMLPMQPRLSGGSIGSLGIPISPVNSMGMSPVGVSGGSPVNSGMMAMSPGARRPGSFGSMGMSPQMMGTPTYAGAGYGGPVVASPIGMPAPPLGGGGVVVGGVPGTAHPAGLSPASMGPPPILAAPGQPLDKRTVVAHVDASGCEPDLAVGQDDKVVLSVPPFAARVWVTWENGQPAAGMQTIELTFPTLQHLSMDYRFGEMELPICETAACAKMQVAELPSTLSYDVKLSTEGAGGRVGFKDKLKNGTEVGYGIFEYELEGEGNLESEHRPECTILWLSGTFKLTGKVTCVNNVQPAAAAPQ